MDRCIIFFVGAVASVISEVFWNGASRWSVALWGGTGMLMLRRILLRFPLESKALLCLLGAALLIVLRWTLLLLQLIVDHSANTGPKPVISVVPSFAYGLYRFLLIAPAYTIIECLEACFGM